MRLLVVKTSSMGDVIHALPALTDALAANPDLEVDWCVESAFAPLVRLHPGVGAVHEIALRRWRKAPFAAATRHAAATLVRALRAGRYDLVIDAQGLIKSALVARLAGAPVAGLDRASAREGLSSLLYGRRIAVPRGLHAVERVRRLFGAALGYAPDLSRIDYGLTPPAADGGQPSVFLIHGTTWASKRWPTAMWIELARGLGERGLVPELTFADADEEPIARAIAEGAPGTQIIARSQLADIAARIGRAAAVVGCDTGLTHLAAAFGRPTVALFMSTAPGLTGVIGNRALTLTARRDCVPCARRNCPLVPAGEAQPCASSLPPASVLAALDGLLEAPAP